MRIQVSFGRMTGDRKCNSQTIIFEIYNNLNLLYNYNLSSPAFLKKMESIFHFFPPSCYLPFRARRKGIFIRLPPAPSGDCTIICHARGGGHPVTCKQQQFQESGASCKSHLLRHSGEPRIGVRGRRRNPELLEKTGFRVALRLPGMTTFSCFQEFCKRLHC